MAERFGNRVPREIDELTSLRGVARKTANVVRGEAFGEPALAIDTHMKRVHQRLGLTASDDPDAIERDLMKLLPRQSWTPHTRRVIHHGRVCCTARAPRCESCPVAAECAFARRARRGGSARGPASRAASR